MGDNVQWTGVRHDHTGLPGVGDTQVVHWENHCPPPDPVISLHPPYSFNCWDSVNHIDKGMHNFGNTCFLNAALQVLFHTPNWLKWLDSSDHKDRCPTPHNCVTCGLINTRLSMCTSKDSRIRPTSLVLLIRCEFKTPGHEDRPQNRGRQEDSHECLVFLLNKVEEEFLSLCASKNIDYISMLTNPVARIFGGWALTKYICSSCSYESSTYSPFTNLTLNILQATSVQQSVTQYFHQDATEEAKCAKCKLTGINIKQFSVHKAPTTLIIALQRFKPDTREKIETCIELSRTITLPEGSRYTVGGGIIHYGVSAVSGHYVAFAQCPDSSLREFNDSEVNSITLTGHKDKVYTQNAYVLFYNMIPQDSSTQSSHDHLIMSQVDISDDSLTIVSGTSECPEPNDSEREADVFEGEPFPERNDISEGECSRDMFEEERCPLPSGSEGDFDFAQVGPSPSSIKVPDGLDSQNSVPVSPGRPPFRPLILSEDDGVPGATLQKKIINNNTKDELTRWLQCRGLPMHGNKPDLVERVAMIIARGRSNILDPKVDGGKWYELKANALEMDLISQNTATQAGQLTQKDIQFPSEGWRPFPSNAIPSNFNYGHIYYYLVESCPTLPCEDEELNSDGDSDESQLMPDPFDEELQSVNEKKTLRKGLTFLKSKHVQGLHDVSEGRCYFIKGQVRASMDLKAYNVKVALSQRSGSVHSCTCTCKQQALGRCVHASAVLLYVWSHIRLNGYGAMTSTSLPKTWDKGALKRKPGAIRDTQYDSFKMNIKRRAYFDPRPTSEQTTELTHQQVNDFLADLSADPEGTLFQKHIDIKYMDEQYCSEVLESVETMCNYFHENLQGIPEGATVLFLTADGFKVYEVPLTSGQHASERWGSLRSIHMSGTTAHQSLTMNTQETIQKFLKDHLWGMNPISTPAMRYGTRSEGKALKAYQREIAKSDPTAVADGSCGLLKREDYPQGAASPDAIKYSATQRPKLVEFKCPYILRDTDPRNFRQVLTKAQISNFCLGWNNEKGYFLKKSHKYYSQVQYYMGILDLDDCDFVVWSRRGLLIVEVLFDEDHWKRLKNAALEIHKKWLAPEYFFKRTPRNLLPVPLQY